MDFRILSVFPDYKNISCQKLKQNKPRYNQALIKSPMKMMRNVFNFTLTLIRLVFLRLLFSDGGGQIDSFIFQEELIQGLIQAVCDIDIPILGTNLDVPKFNLK